MPDDSTDSSAFTFPEWVDLIFDRAVGPSWYINTYTADWWDAPPAVGIEYVTRLFENPRDLPRRFTRPQLAQGLWFLASAVTGSKYFFWLYDERVPWPARRQCIRSIGVLFERVFAPLCRDTLSHVPTPAGGEDDPLATTCFMWWELFPTFPVGPDDDAEKARVKPELLAVMEAALRLKSEACAESSLHGLGHEINFAPAAVPRIEDAIDGFLAGWPGPSAELRAYALRARAGAVQ